MQLLLCRRTSIFRFRTLRAASSGESGRIVGIDRLERASGRAGGILAAVFTATAAGISEVSTRSAAYSTLLSLLCRANRPILSLNLRFGLRYKKGRGLITGMGNVSYFREDVAKSSWRIYKFTNDGLDTWFLSLFLIILWSF